ncbi:DUF2203 domain-containing protein [Tundrisphaera sp. TA3]|uniref:DUF2203 domain-containing protein n=1 Tax=Tundrisphaera sp. TA3 TaxID=3435775 RepID=UPI003EBD7C26
MASSNPVEGKRKFFSVEDANKALPLVKVIVDDIVRQFAVVNELKARLASIQVGRRPSSNDLYSEESAQSQSLLEAEEATLISYIEELTKLGVELKGPDGLCDFPSLRDGREVYLCWRLGEPQVAYWHELNAGVAGRMPLERLSAKSGSGIV